MPVLTLPPRTAIRLYVVYCSVTLPCSDKRRCGEGVGLGVRVAAA